MSDDLRGAARPRRLRWIVAAAALLVLVATLFGWSPVAALAARLSLKTDEIIAEQRPDPLYEQLFPRYVEICATSQWRKELGGSGGPFGHAVLYLKGACRAEGTQFPQLRRCERAATSLDDPEHGAGVSVGRFFSNVNWIAVPGYRLFHDGNVKTSERLTQERFDATVQQAIDLGVFEGVEFREGWAAPGQSTLKDFVAQHSAGTDFALTYARNVFCARVPVTEPMMDEIITFLNEKNVEYATGKADYNWNLFWDNCVHTVRNALAAANVWEPIAVWDLRLRSLLNMAVPANEFLNLAILGAEGSLEDYREIQDNGPSRDALHEWGWLPNRPGALVKFLPAHQENDLFDPSFRLFAVQSLFSMGAAAETLRLMSDPRFVDLEANLRHHTELYRSIEERHEARYDPLASVRGTPYRRASRLHLEYIRRERAETEALLARLLDLKAARGTAAALGQ